MADFPAYLPLGPAAAAFHHAPQAALHVLVGGAGGGEGAGGAAGPVKPPKKASKKAADAAAAVVGRGWRLLELSAEALSLEDVHAAARALVAAPRTLSVVGAFDESDFDAGVLGLG